MAANLPVAGDGGGAACGFAVLADVTCYASSPVPDKLRDDNAGLAQAGHARSWSQ